MKNLTSKRCDVGASCPGVYEITPEDLQCGGSQSSCPGVYEITPADLQCEISISCPSVHAISNSGDLIIVGKRLPPELQAQMEGKVGDDEYAVIIDRALLANVER